MNAPNAVWWDLGISINTSVSSHLVQTEQAITRISRIVTSLLFSAPVRAEVDLIAGDSCALLTTAYSNAEQSFMVILTSVARKNYPSPFPKGPRWLMPFNMKFYKLQPLCINTCSLICCTSLFSSLTRFHCLFSIPSPSLSKSYTLFCLSALMPFKAKYDGRYQHLYHMSVISAF